MTDKLIIKLPFCGFYESLYTHEVDNIEEMEAEHRAGEQEEEGIPSELRLDESDFASILFDVMNYGACYAHIARNYVPAFDHVASEPLGIPLGLEFECMKSPREYNFETDRIFAYISPSVVEALFAKSAADGHERLKAQIGERFTSRSGFMSHYDNGLDEWLDKPVLDWDHNELETLLLACLDITGEFNDRDSSLSWAVYEAMTYNDGLYNEWSGAVDWKKFDERVKEAREEKVEAIRALKPEYVPPAPRCPDTPDMLRGS